MKFSKDKITPFLWFDSQAEEAAKFYCSIFPKSKIHKVYKYPEGVPGVPKGKVMTVSFEIKGQKFTAMNAGPHFKFNESISFVVLCDSQAEVDFYWKKLTSGGGEESMCGWLKDKYGLSWQITPKDLIRMNTDKNREKAGRAMAAMMTMRKIDIKKMRKAFDGK
jgi:predicted 3-demethylubiquinone-9 3-methyltransferase (glyoxalase superfamily)